jgi:hypothetical protein
LDRGDALGPLWRCPLRRDERTHDCREVANFNLCHHVMRTELREPLERRAFPLVGGACQQRSNPLYELAMEITETGRQPSQVNTSVGVADRTIVGG